MADVNNNTASIFENHMPYTVVSNELARDRRLSLKARGLATYMGSMANGWNFSIKNLVEGTGEGRDKVIGAINELIGAGYLKRTAYKDKQGYFRSRYDLYPSPCAENPCTENPYEENPHEENPYNIEEHNNRITSIKNNMGNDSSRDSSTPKKKAYAELVKLTEKEYSTLLELMGEQLTKGYIESLNNWKGSKGKKTKSDYYTIRSWYNKDKKEGKVKANVIPAVVQTTTVQQPLVSAEDFEELSL